MEFNPNALSSFQTYLLVKALQKGFDQTSPKIRMVVEKLEQEINPGSEVPFDEVASAVIGTDSYDAYLKGGFSQPDEFELDKTEVEQFLATLDSNLDEIEYEFGEPEVATESEPEVPRSLLDSLLDTVDIPADVTDEVTEYEMEITQSLEAKLSDTKVETKAVGRKIVPTDISSQLGTTTATPKTVTPKATKEPKTKVAKAVTPKVEKVRFTFTLNEEIVTALLEKIRVVMSFNDVTGHQFNWLDRVSATETESNPNAAIMFERDFHKIKKSSDSRSRLEAAGIPFEIDEVNATGFELDNGPEFVVFTFESILVILDRNSKVGNEKMNLVFAGDIVADSDKLNKLLLKYKMAMTRYNNAVPGAIRWA